MKRVSFYLMLFVAAVLMASCSNDEITPEVIVPEVTFPDGSIDYFENSLDFDNHASEKSISFVSNVPWTISVDETRNGDVWCAVSPTQGEAGAATITIRVEENLSYDDRNAVLRLSYGDSIKNIFVNQKQLDALTLTSDRFEVPAEGGLVDVEVKANVDYTVVISDECKGWIHQVVSPSKKSLSTNSLQFQVDQTEEYNQREGKILIQSGDKSETITVYQAGEGILSLTKKEFNLSSSEQNIAIEVNSNFEYEIEMPSVDWISEIRTKGLSTHTINLHIAENETYDSRSATIRLYDKNSDISENIVVSQSQMNAILFETQEYEFDENGGTFTVKINSNVDYEIEIADVWVTESSQKRALEEYSHTFSVSPLTENFDRETRIRFSDANLGVSEEIVVKQNRSIFFDDISYELLEGSTMQLNLVNRTNQSVTYASSDESVVAISAEGQLKTLSKGNATITATTQDGKHKCTCTIYVYDITYYIWAYNAGASIFNLNGVIQSGSSLRWSFVNNSNESVTLKSLQLIGGDGQEGNLMDVNTIVNSYSTVSYSTTIGILGITAPVKCKFLFEYDGKEYTVTAVYSD